jgi:hypothetical protein
MHKLVQFEAKNWQIRNPLVFHSVKECRRGVFPMSHLHSDLSVARNGVARISSQLESISARAKNKSLRDESLRNECIAHLAKFIRTAIDFGYVATVQNLFESLLPKQSKFGEEGFFNSTNESEVVLVCYQNFLNLSRKVNASACRSFFEKASLFQNPVIRGLGHSGVALFHHLAGETS